MNFVGREQELKLLQNWNQKSSRIAVIYGRRRVGKTRLVEEAFKNKIIVKFEGMEELNQNKQKKAFLQQLSSEFNSPELRDLTPKNWNGLLKLLSNYLGTTPCVVFFDEFQWMAGDRNDLISNLKFVWDNFFTKKNKIFLILCGSVSSFMVKKVLRSKAFYGRVDLEINLPPLLLPAILKQMFPKRSVKEIIELYMVVGGIPQYLKMIDLSNSIRLNIEQLCFTSNGYLVNEVDRILISHFGKNKVYRNILFYLSNNWWGDRSEIGNACNIVSGGRLSDYLEELELAGFIEKYISIDKPYGQRNARYRIIDPYLIFYFNFIYPHLKKINQPGPPFPITHYLPDKKYKPWQGRSFERICHTHNRQISEKLGFGSVQYHSGSWFGKGKNNKKAQIDLIYIRADNVITLCEIKFKSNKIGTDVISEVERKINTLPNPKQHTIEKVLISLSEPSKLLLNEGYFHRILTVKDIFHPGKGSHKMTNKFLSYNSF